MTLQDKTWYAYRHKPTGLWLEGFGNSRGVLAYEDLQPVFLESEGDSLIEIVAAIGQYVRSTFRYSHEEHKTHYELTVDDKPFDPVANGWIEIDVRSAVIALEAYCHHVTLGLDHLCYAIKYSECEVVSIKLLEVK